jgi:hypothetical protein
MYYLSFPLSPDAVSISPPNSLGFVSTSASSINSTLDNYEVEVVEIRVTEKDLDSRKEARYKVGASSWRRVFRGKVSHSSRRQHSDLADSNKTSWKTTKLAVARS